MDEAQTLSLLLTAAEIVALFTGAFVGVVTCYLTFFKKRAENDRTSPYWSLIPPRDLTQYEEAARLSLGTTIARTALTSFGFGAIVTAVLLGATTFVGSILGSGVAFSYGSAASLAIAGMIEMGAAGWTVQRWERREARKRGLHQPE